MSPSLKIRFSQRKRVVFITRFLSLLLTSTAAASVSHPTTRALLASANGTQAAPTLQPKPMGFTPPYENF
ncbi:MAG: hypothetical protein RLZZ350_877 [Verrucomicrobiota bacterium]|jgi:hypothetical protein